jgi:glycosyltransferase involved in cell wall biosynthesis
MAMEGERDGGSRRLRILHVFRAPLGGLFRHVVDLANAQVERGHEVGLFFDSQARGDSVARALASISGGLALGVWGAPIRRDPHFTDIPALAKFRRLVARVQPDILHGHGSKGGFYARSIGMGRGHRGPARAYTPHGGSFNFQPGTLTHRAYMAAERMLAMNTDVFLFESAYIAGRFNAYVGADRGMRRIVANGISAAEFEMAPPNPDAADYLYVGELRAAKGIDTLLDAIAIAGSRLGRIPRTVLVGSGPDKEILRARALKLGIADRLDFPGPMPVRQAFKLGRVMIVPSRAESMPYVVLEAAAARVPLVATNVGGIPEIFGPYRNRLGPSGDPEDLCERMLCALLKSQPLREAQAADLAQHVAANFSIDSMVSSVMSGYRDALLHRLPKSSGARVAGIQSEI